MKNTYRVSVEAHKDISNYGSYDLIRKIASCIDGQKNAARKIISTVIDRNIDKEIKVSQLSAKAAEEKEYLHGSMDGVIVNMAQNFVGSNNLPLLAREGNFGTRFIQEASASRYIYTFKEKYVDLLFRKEDLPSVPEQFFEGSKIEPKFYVPTLPLLLINGSEGISSGFAQKILPRRTKNIIEAVRQLIDSNGKTIDDKLLVPYYEGFNGTVEPGESSNQWLLKGSIRRLTVARVEINEVPSFYDLKSYLEVLDKLEEQDFIKGYTDKSTNDKFLFEVQMEAKKLASLSDDELMDKLKLIRRVSENYTSMSEENKIIQFESAEEILRHYFKVKLDFMQKRKDRMISTYEHDIQVNMSKFLFVEGIVEGSIIVSNKTKAEIVAQLVQNENILTIDGNYDYLLRMPVYSLSKDKLEELRNTILKLDEQLERIRKMSPSDLWKEDLAILEQNLSL